jgi:hypothetical protein
MGSPFNMIVSVPGAWQSRHASHAETAFAPVASFWDREEVFALLPDPLKPPPRATRARTPRPRDLEQSAQGGAGIASSMPSQVRPSFQARESPVTASWPCLRPWALRRAALRRDTAVYANHARQQGTTAVGEPTVLRSPDTVVVLAKHAGAMRHRWRAPRGAATARPLGTLDRRERAVAPCRVGT